MKVSGSEKITRQEVIVKLRPVFAFIPSLPNEIRRCYTLLYIIIYMTQVSDGAAGLCL